MSGYRLLLLSSSRRGDEDYLSAHANLIQQHLSASPPVVFIPYAGVTINASDYTQKVANALPSLNIQGIHEFNDPFAAIENAGAVMVGGGNTFNLLTQLYKHNLAYLLAQRINAGMPYVGWSAGANICGQSIKTTNDMPIIQPPSFDALKVLPFQINPHYIDEHPEGFNGETRDQRILEFTALNPSTPVVAIKEGAVLTYMGRELQLLSHENAYVFKGNSKHPITPGQSLNYLLNGL